MVSIAEQYMDEMHDEFKYFATWLPGNPLHIGDIGELDNNEFTYISNLNKKGIDFEVQTDSSKNTLEHTTKGDVSISTKLNGEIGIPKFNLDVADAGIIVEFGIKGGIAFNAEGVKNIKITEVDKIDQEIKNRWDKGLWKDNWVVISELVIADSTTILISNEKNASIALKAKIQVPKLSLASIDANFEPTYKKSINTSIICQSELTPLFKARGVHKEFWRFGRATVGAKKGIELNIPDISIESSSRPSNKIVGEIEYQPFK